MAKKKQYHHNKYGKLPESKMTVLIGVALSAFAICTIHTVWGAAHAAQLAQGQVICPTLMLGGVRAH